MLIELKYGFDIFYNERIRAITSLFSVLSVPAYALFWTVFISYFHKYIKIIFLFFISLVCMADFYCCI